MIDNEIVKFPNYLQELFDGLIVEDNEVKRTCVCLSEGKDDGDFTCWLHHDCMTDDNCTHNEVD